MLILNNSQDRIKENTTDILHENDPIFLSVLILFSLTQPLY